MFPDALRAGWALSLLLMTAVALPAQDGESDWACSPWESVSPKPFPLELSALVSTGDQLMAFGDSGAAASDDGLSWRRVTQLDGHLSSALWTGDEFLGTLGNTILASTDGVTWVTRHEVPQDPIFFSILLRSIAGNGGQLVVVGEDYSDRFDMWSPVLLTSADGIAWSRPDFPAAPDPSHVQLSAVIWAMNRFVATGSYLLTSHDGVTWSKNDSVRGNSLASNGELVVVADDIGLFLSSDLETWSTAPSPVTDGHMGWAGDRFWLAGSCAACLDHEPSLWSSTDGESWERISLDAPIELRAFNSHGSRLVAVGGGTAATDDGERWQTSCSHLSSGLSGITTDGGRMVAVGTGGEVLSTAQDGVWQRVLWGGTDRLEDVAWGPAGFVAVGGDVVLTSIDGEHWTKRSIPGVYLNLVASNGLIYIAAGEDAIAYASTDGETWTAMGIDPDVTDFRDLVTNDDVFVAGVRRRSQGGALLTSHDGVTWQHTADTQSRWPELAWGGGRFLATDDSRTLSSEDGNEWQEVFTGLQFGKPQWIDDRFVAWVDYSDSFYSSSDGAGWSQTVGPTRPGYGATMAVGSSLWRVTPSGTIDRAACGERVTQTVLPALAHLPGAEGTQWQSDLEIHNPGADRVTIGLVATARDEVAPGAQFAISLEGGAAQRLDDVLASWFGLETAASIRLTSWSGSALAVARTYNASPAGTFGQGIAAEHAGAALSGGYEGRLIQLSYNADRSRGARTNLGLVNIGGVDDDVMIELRRSDGSFLGRQGVGVRTGESIQLHDIFRTHSSSDVDDAFAIVTPGAPDSRLLAYASVVDNLSGDPVFVLPAPRVESGRSAWLAGAGHGLGLAGSDWRTDVELANPGANDATCRVDIFPWASTEAPELSLIYEVPAGQSVRIEDIVALVGRQTGASLRLTASAGAVMASGRTYTVTAGGTYGQYLPLLTELDAITEREPQRLIMLRQSATNGVGFRTNLGLVNIIADSCDVQIEVHDASGAVLGTLNRTLGPLESVQLTEVLGLVAAEGSGATGGGIDDAYAIVSVATAGGRVLAYASLIDDRTNDPVLIVAVRD